VFCLSPVMICFSGGFSLYMLDLWGGGEDLFSMHV
jgi:hypothetical protein